MVITEKYSNETVNSSKQPKRNAILAWIRKESYFKVHQKRKVSDEFYIVTPTSLLQGEKWNL